MTQARSDLRVFETLLQHPQIEICHPLHFLQMALEKLSKAAEYSSFGTVTKSHFVISRLPVMLMRRELAAKLGFKNNNDSYFTFLRRSTRFFNAIESLSPAVASLGQDMPNVEYPWELPSGNSWQTPCKYNFPAFSSLNDRSEAGRTLRFLKMLFERFEEIFNHNINREMRTKWLKTSTSNISWKFY